MFHVKIIQLNTLSTEAKFQVFVKGYGFVCLTKYLKKKIKVKNVNS